MKKLLFYLFGIFIITQLLSCSSDDKTVVNINVDKNAPNAEDGFDLEQFHRLLIEEKPESGEWDAKFLSDLVNRDDINNLDLNLDGKVDRIFIEPFGGGNEMGFELYVKPTTSSEQTICTVVVKKDGDKADLSVSGNEQIYGQHHYYHSSGLSNMLMMYWMFSPRYPMGGYYRGGWDNGRYGNRNTASKSDYQSKKNARNANYKGAKAPANARTSTKPSSISNAARQQRVANSGIKSKLKNPTSTQRKFRSSQIRRSGSGFSGKKSTGTRSRTSTGRRSGRSFGK